MVRRIAQESRTGQIMLPPGLAAAPVLDLMCTHFVPPGLACQCSGSPAALAGAACERT